MRRREIIKYFAFIITKWLSDTYVLEMCKNINVL